MRLQCGRDQVPFSPDTSRLAVAGSRIDSGDGHALRSGPAIVP